MRKRSGTRHAISLDRRNRLADMVLGYMAKKYDIKGEIGIGEKDIGADKELP